VSVVRGDGANSGLPCIDDHIRMVEPVYNYLTRFSGLNPGDLDAPTSRHYLTTLKHAYLKLR
jgi:PAB-dependent poly(A)-specific ribonuclease subunit 2